jgi:SAM-dependent methyltransferase
MPDEMLASQSFDDGTFDFESLQECATHKRDPFFELAWKYCTDGCRVLDVGAGLGEFANGLGKCEAHLLDGNRETVEHLKLSHANVHFHKMPSPLPFKDGFFDVAHCSHLVEHLEPQALFDLLVELDRCLAYQGVLIVSTPLMWHGFYDDLSHVRPYPPSVFKNYLVGSKLARTRTAISQEYHVEELQYRYSRKPVAYFDISHSQMWSKRLLFRIMKWLRGINCAQYEQSGYTIVLRKIPPAAVDREKPSQAQSVVR